MRTRHALPVILLIAGAAMFMQHATGPATAELGGERLRLAVADDPAERERGLMHRKELPQDGMLFVFPREAEQVFWMKNTSIPIDIIFVAENRTVMHVASADPEPGVAPSRLTRYTGTARYVIETRQGFAADHSIRPGDRVSLTLPRKALN